MKRLADGISNQSALEASNKYVVEDLKKKK